MQKHINHMACLTEWAIDTWQEATHLVMNKTRCIAKAQKLATHLAFRSSEIGPAIPKNIPLISCSPHFSAHNMYFFSIFSTLSQKSRRKAAVQILGSAVADGPPPAPPAPPGAMHFSRLCHGSKGHSLQWIQRQAKDRWVQRAHERLYRCTMV